MTRCACTRARDSPTSKRGTVKVADGVYEIRRPDAPDHFTQGNTVVVIGEAGVLVVDSCCLPSSAQEDIAKIRQWMNKPARYLLNTHWHNDHVQGNAAYMASSPGIAVIAHTETAKLMALRVGSYLMDDPHRMERFQKELDTGKDENGRTLTADKKEDLAVAVSGGKAASEAVSEEFRECAYEGYWHCCQHACPSARLCSSTSAAVRIQPSIGRYMAGQECCDQGNSCLRSPV